MRHAACEPCVVREPPPAPPGASYVPDLPKFRPPAPENLPAELLCVNDACTTAAAARYWQRFPRGTREVIGVSYRCPTCKTDAYVEYPLARQPAEKAQA